MKRWEMNTMTKRVGLLALSGAFVVGVAACGGGGGGDEDARVSVAGRPYKGLFIPGATVVLAQMASGTTTGLSDKHVSTSIDDEGKYTAEITWRGPTVVSVSGQFWDEDTNAEAEIAEEAALKAAIDVAAAGETDANPNVLSTAAAQLAIEDAINGSEDLGVSINAAGNTIASKLGIVLAANEKLTSLDFSPSGRARTSAEERAFLTSVSMLSVVNTGVDLASIITRLVASARSGATFEAEMTEVANYNAGGLAMAMRNNAERNLRVSRHAEAGKVSEDAPAMQAFASDIDKIKGIGCANNQITVGTGATASYGDDGVFAGVIALGSNADASFSCSVRAFNNAGATAAETWMWVNVPFSFFVADTDGNRQVAASLDKVTVSVGGSATSTPSSVSVSVPEDAVLTFVGINSAGSKVTGSVTNATHDISDVVSTNGDSLTIDADDLLSRIQVKVGSDSDLHVLETSGTYRFQLGFGVPVGIINDAGSALSRAVPVGSGADNKVSGARVTGTLSVQ